MISAGLFGIRRVRCERQRIIGPWSMPPPALLYALRVTGLKFITSSCLSRPVPRVPRRCTEQRARICAARRVKLLCHKPQSIEAIHEEFALAVLLVGLISARRRPLKLTRSKRNAYRGIGELPRRSCSFYRVTTLNFNNL